MTTRFLKVDTSVLYHILPAKEEETLTGPGSLDYIQF